MNAKHGMLCLIARGSYGLLRIARVLGIGLLGLMLPLSLVCLYLKIKRDWNWQEARDSAIVITTFILLSAVIIGISKIIEKWYQWSLNYKKDC